MLHASKFKCPLNFVHIGLYVGIITVSNCEEENRLGSAPQDLDTGQLTNMELLEPPLEPYEGMEFTSFEDAKNYYTRYAKRKGFSFCMGRLTKSRTNGVVIGQEIVCSKEGFQAKKICKMGRYEQ